MSTKRNIFLFVILLGWKCCSSQIVNVKVWVVDSATNQPLESAYAELYQYNTKINAASSDSIGKFKFKIAAGQSYILRLNYIGYSTMEIPLLVNKDTTLLISMCNYLIELNSLEVRGRMNSVSVTIDDPIFWVDDKSTISEIHTLYQFYNNIGDIIYSLHSKIPGAYSKREGVGGEIQFYGSRADATQIIIDGVKVTGDYHIPNNTIYYIGVFDQGIPVKYGDVTGGVIEITTKNALNFW